MLIKRLGAFALLTSLALPFSAPADITGGIAWLATQPNADGSFGATPTSLATSVQTTAEVLRAYQVTGQITQPAYAPALAYVNADPETNTEFLARKIMVNVGAGTDVTALANALVANQNGDGGFGDQPGYASSVLDTALALQALAAANYTSGPIVSAAAGYLLNRQQANGGWADGENATSIYVSAAAMRALWHYRNAYQGVTASLSKAQNFLLSQRAADGLWGEHFVSASALIALVPNVSDLSLIASATTALAGAQQANGSWSDDAYTTALALQALRAYELRATGSSPTTGSLSGYVLKAGSTEPVVGAAVSLRERTSAAVTTNGDGYYLIANVPAGAYTIEATKSGFNPASTTATVQAGQVSAAANLLLALADQTGQVNGAIFDSAELQPISSAVVTLSATAATYTAVTDATGKFVFNAVGPGPYSVSIQKSGYYTVTGAASVAGGETLTINQGLTREGAFQDDQPGPITGTVINAKTALPVAGATFDLGGGLSAVSGTNGAFTIPSVPRGNYSATLTATGFNTQSYSIAFPAGAAGQLGTLAIYPASSDTAPTTLRLTALVVDGVSRAPVGNATVTLVETAASATTGADGRALMENIAIKSFSLAVSVSGYPSSTFGVQVAAFGDAQVTLPLAPAGDGTSFTTLSGQVTDAQTGAALAGARIAVEGTSLTATADANGQYSLSGISTLGFTVSVSALGYANQAQPVQVSAHGNYTLNPTLEALTEAGIQVVSVIANEGAKPANSTALFTAQVANLLNTARSALVIGEVVNAAGESVATTLPYAEGTTVPTALFSFLESEVKTLTVPWATTQFAPGTYRMILRAVEPGTINAGNPRGQILAENSTETTIVASQAIDGAMAIDPPLTQAGATTPVNFSALVRNDGNVPLDATDFELIVTRADTGAVLHTVQVPAGPIEVAANVEVSFGDWVPTESGNLNALVRVVGGTIPGAITGELYVGDKASGTFTLDKTVVPEGTQTVHGKINLKGVDVRTGGSTDPLFPLVKKAVEKGGQYTAPRAKNWHNTNRCLGCHIQTQSLFGLASSLDKAPIDAEATKFLYNAIASSQRPNGALYISHPQHSKTQSQLGGWALTAWPNKEESFRTIFKAANYHYQVRSQSGNTTFWTTDHSSGWWYSNQASTTLALSGMTDVLRTSQAIDLTQIRDYSLGPAINGGYGSGMLDVELGPDGALYVAKHDTRNVNRIDLTTGQVTTELTDLPNYTYGIAFAPNGLMFVSGKGFLLRRNADGTKQVILTSGSDFTDVELGPDGLLYVAEFHFNRIRRVSPTTGQAEVYVSGGLLNGPTGLAFDDAGNLLVTNYYAYNVLKVAANRSVTVFADGLAYQPIYITPASNGDMYVSTTGLNGLTRISSKGVAERMLSADALRGIAEVNGKFYVGNQTANTLQELLVSPLNTSALQTLRNELPRVANYFLSNYKDNSSDNTVQAMRMIGLAYLRDTITDNPTLVANINAAIAYEDALLRARQRADGGWGRFVGWGSDPLITAMVGIAIDYTDPSADDPQVRKTIQYLLNTQASDGSWFNNGNGLSTRLASTSFVMAYLPRALERLGGIDVDLHMDVAANVQLSNPSIAPTAVLPSPDGGKEYIWKLLGVTNAGRKIEFDLTLANMQLHEQRPVARSAYMEFANSFTDEKLQVALEVPNVRAASEMTLGVATDKPSYQANEPVAISGTVTNTGPTIASGEVHLAIRAAGETTFLAELAPIPVTNLAAGAALPYTSSWNTGSTFPGTFEVYARLFDTQGRLLVEATAPFNIGAPAVHVSTSVTTDKPVYEAWDSVQINGRVQNTAANAQLAPSRVEITVRTPAGAVLFFDTRKLGELAPLALRDVPFPMPLADAASGTYPVELVLKDEFTRTVLSQSTTSFQVVRRAVQALSGAVNVTFPIVHQGDPNGCTETAKNVSGTALSGVRLIHQLIDMDAGAVIDEFVEIVDLAAGGIVHNYFRNVDTAGMALGGYSCVIKGEINGDLKTLAFGGFQVIEPPIKIDAELKTGTKGRVLILLDPASSCGGTCLDDTDPHGPESAPGLANQRLFLEALLENNGWSYTLVESAEAFTFEMRSGNYNLYALFNEQEKLAEQAQKELREAIFRGEGLLVAGAHDHRELHTNKLLDTLGIDATGHDPKASEIAFTESALNLTGKLALLSGDQLLRIEPLSAVSAARYTNPSNGNHTPEAVTLNAYGTGKAAFAAFDLVALATLEGDQGLAAKLILHALSWATPTDTPNLTGTVKAIDLTLANQGIDATAIAAITLPAGVTVLDPMGGVLTDNILTFTTPLAVDEVKTLTFWVKLPTTAGEITLNATVTAEEHPDPLATPSLTLTVSTRDLASAMTTLDALLAANHPNTKELKQAKQSLERALAAGSTQQALAGALKATDALLGISDPDIVALRQAIDQWLRIVSQQL